ncbi:MAG TPA: class I adenylate-forming enzyme family protein [Solirubrobacter sp.]|nr:class I adenylate-forming enzyme family protein [Solirubrobacter sp.]
MTAATRYDALSYLAGNAARRGGATAVLDQDEAIDFDRLLAAVRALLADLHQRGVQPGDVVAVAMPSVWRYVALELAIPALGAILLPIPLGVGRREVDAVLARTGAKLAIVSDAPHIAAAANAANAAVLAPETLATAVAPGPVPAPAPPQPDRIVEIAMTSGTTGLPKLAALSAELKQVTFEGFTSRLRLGPGDRVLPTSPITQGVGAMCLYALRTGAALVMLHEPRFAADRAIALTAATATTVLAGVPTTIGRMLTSPALAGADLRALRATLSAGAPLPRQVAEAWERRTGSRVCSFYGAMDIGQLAVPSPEDPAEKRWTTVGRPHDRAELLICDPAGRPLPPGAEGEICMRGPLVQNRYWGEAHGPFAEDGWAHFGDLGVLDPDGYLRITGRIKDTIIRGGNNVNPLEVEDLLRACAEIEDACVVARPDRDLGERAVAFLVPADGARPGLDEVVAHLERAQLARYKWPEHVELIDALPTGVTGKVDRGALRERAAHLEGS